MSDDFPARRLQTILHEQIPLAREMGAVVRSWGPEGLEIEAPLAPNFNHHGTFFGGSASALGILAGWSLTHLLTLDAGLDADIVIQRAEVRYSAPAPGAVIARALPPDEAQWERFRSRFGRRGRARMRLRIVLRCGDVQVAVLDAGYAALARDG